ncbi:para-aminobenzoate synthase component I [Bacillus sp. TS-2]|nr:para-aminobenzoate synthase component I [Bacillus sp. TS-2]
MLEHKHGKWKTIATSFKLDDKSWFNRYKQLSAEKTHHVLLESGRGGTYSIMGLNPFAILQGRDRELSVFKGESKEIRQGDLLELLKEELSSYQTESIAGLPPFQGGAIGYLSYDMIREFEELPNIAKDDLKLPELYFMLFHEVFVYDHAAQKLTIILTDLEEQAKPLHSLLNEWELLWKTEVNDPHQWSLKDQSLVRPVSSSLEEEQFAAAVDKIKDYIAAGDVFQVNLSVRHSRKMITEPMHVYEVLRKLNPSPYMSFLETPDFQFVSASPELLVKKQGSKISTRPIAGTRSRGLTKEEDELLESELLANEKERAEHVMLVDLERNDLGRVASYGSVSVDELLVVEKYSHVMHLVSNVVGSLHEDYDLYDLIRATFPGGTITGAPKIRTMEIIEELEPLRRSIYTGSIGWIGFNGEMELNIAIRTMVCKDHIAYIQAGAGIVIDSNPVFEYKESLKKAKALWRALELSEEEVLEKTFS